MIAVAIPVLGSLADTLVKLAYTVWNKLIGYCYQTLEVSPFEFGEFAKTEHGETIGLISEVLNKSETTIIGVGTGLLILVWVVGILREGGNLISDRAHPYAVLAHVVRFFICEGLIAGYFVIIESLFDLFTLATEAVIGSSSNYGLIDPSSTSLKEFFTDADVLSGLAGKDNLAIIELFSPSATIFDLADGSFALTDVLLVDIFALIYLVAVIACALVIFMKVYGRYFRIIIAIVLTPIGVSFFGSSHTEQNARKFIFYLLKQGAEGLVIALDLLLYGLVVNYNSLTPGLVTALANGMTGSPEVGAMLSYLISQIFYCVLLMTIISASEKMCEQLL